MKIKVLFIFFYFFYMHNTIQANNGIFEIIKKEPFSSKKFIRIDISEVKLILSDLITNYFEGREFFYESFCSTDDFFHKISYYFFYLNTRNILELYLMYLLSYDIGEITLRLIYMNLDRLNLRFEDYFDEEGFKPELFEIDVKEVEQISFAEFYILNTIPTIFRLLV